MIEVVIVGGIIYIINVVLIILCLKQRKRKENEKDI